MPDETVLLIRNYDEGRWLLSECAETGRLLAGVRIATPFMLAQEICSSVLAKKDAPRLLTKGEMQDLLFRSLLGMPAEGFFAKPHVRERKTAEIFLATISELNRELVQPLSGNDRLKAVQQLREKWQEVKGESLLDEADLLWMAIQMAETERNFQDTGFVVLSTEVFPKLDRKLIDVVAKERLTVFPVEVPENARIPKSCTGASGQPIRIDRESLQFWRCRGIETEQEAIMRDILSRNLPAEDCAVIYLSTEYAPGLYAAAKQFHLPIFLQDGVPMTDSSVYDVLKLVQTWAFSEYNAEELRKPILSGALKIASGRQFCHELRWKNIGWGKERYKLMLRQDESGFPDEETAENWKKTLDLLFQASEEEGTSEEQKRVLLQLLGSTIGVSTEKDAYALAAARNLLLQITWLEEGETVLARLMELLEQTNVPTGEKETGSILAVPLSQAFCTGRKVLYFCGLARFSMQSGATESPILLDEERIRLGLAGKQEKEIQTTFQLLLSLAQREGEAILSYNDYDMERMNPLSPAPVYRSLAGDSEIRIISCIPDEPLTAGDLVSIGMRVAVHAQNAPGEDRGERENSFALQEEKSFEEVMNNMAFSASSLETALSCPFRFYMQRLLGQYPPSIPERRNDSWLEANEMGTLCHAVLEQYYRNPDKGWTDILETEIGKLKEMRPEGPESAVKADTEKAKKMISRAIAWTENAGRQVIATEKPFGKNAHEEPMVIQIEDKSLKLSGSIDRVDRTKDGTIAILDYKTGGGGSYRDSLEVKLQQYLYTRAAECLDPEQAVTEGGYLFLRDAADYLQVRLDSTEREKKENTILSLLEWMKAENRALIAAPAFDIQEDGSFDSPGSADARQKKYEKCSRYCEFTALCPAQTQIQEIREPESREVAADE